MKILPAILEKDYESVTKRLDLYSKVATNIQVDVCDGVFVPSLTWLPSEYDKLNGYIINIEMDMMVDDVEKYLDALYLSDVKRIIIHSNKMDIAKFMMLYEMIKSHNSFILVGICDDDIVKIQNAYGYYDYVQLMGIKNIGEQGQIFDESVLDKIKSLKSFLTEKNPQSPLFIQVDGGMKRDTIELCQVAGAESFVVGSVFKNINSEEELRNVYTELKTI